MGMGTVRNFRQSSAGGGGKNLIVNAEVRDFLGKNEK